MPTFVVHTRVRKHPPARLPDLGGGGHPTSAGDAVPRILHPQRMNQKRLADTFKICATRARGKGNNSRKCPGISPGTKPNNAVKDH